MTPAPLLDRPTLRRALTLLARGLGRRRVRADVYVFRGAAMVLAYGAERATRDVDALFEPHGPVLEEAQAVAEELGLGRSWLNEQASVYLASGRDAVAAPVFDHPHLRVQAASAEHLLAMKALAARPQDLDDLRLLLAHLHLERAGDVLAIVGRVFPEQPIPERTRLAIEDLVGDR